MRSLLILSALLLIFFLPLVKAECFPEYTCGVWSDCKDGLQSRTCTDKKCGNRDIIERDFCQKEGCKPQIECGSWSQCFYTEKTSDLIKGKVTFGGYRNRVCFDKNDCIESLIQEGTCEETYELQLAEVEECGQNILSVVDPKSERQIAKINLLSWKSNKLDISFVQGKSEYCPSCYNALQDNGETGLDCGGPCKECKKEDRTFITSVILLLWTASAIFTFLTLKEVSILKK